MYVLTIMFALAGQPQVEVNLLSVSREACASEGRAVQEVLRTMGVESYATKCASRVRL